MQRQRMRKVREGGREGGEVGGWEGGWDCETDPIEITICLKDRYRKSTHAVATWDGIFLCLV